MDTIKVTDEYKGDSLASDPKGSVTAKKKHQLEQSSDAEVITQGIIKYYLFPLCKYVATQKSWASKGYNTTTKVKA